jgi:RNA polymerase sigma factor (TIGR02999 family)
MIDDDDSVRNPPGMARQDRAATDAARREITQLLRAWTNGDAKALDQLVPLVYDELRRQASRYMVRENVGHTLQTTALVHEAYLRLADQRDVHWESRSQFFGIAAQLMRRVLVDHARTRDAAKRGGDAIRVTLDGSLDSAGEPDADVIELDDALTRLAMFDARQAHVVELRYFAGLRIEEVAEVLGLSRATVDRDWAMARAWLRRELRAS